MSAIKYLPLQTKKQLSDLINESINTVKSMQEKVQVTAMAIVVYAESCGDYRGANDLLAGIDGTGVRKNALIEWFNKFLGVEFNEDKQMFMGKLDKEAIRKNKDKAQNTMWWSLKPEPAYKGFDLMEEIAKLVKRAEKAAQVKTEAEKVGDEAKAKLVDISPDAMSVLRKLDLGIPLNTANEEKAEPVAEVPANEEKAA